MAYRETRSGSAIRNFNKEHHVRPRDREIEDTQSSMLTQRASRPTRTRGMVNDGKDQYTDSIKKNGSQIRTREKPAASLSPLPSPPQRANKVYCILS